MYKTIIIPVLSYGCETWIFKTSDVNLLMRFEIHFFKKILAPQLLEDGRYHTQFNQELRFIKSQRLHCYVHVLRLSSERTTKKVFEAKPEGARKRARPRRRLLQDVEDHIRKIKTPQHGATALCRDKWRCIVEEAMVQPGL